MMAAGEVALIDRMQREKSGFVPRVAMTTVTSWEFKVGKKAGGTERYVQEAMIWMIRRVYRQSLSRG